MSLPSAPAPVPQGDYVPATRFGQMIYTAGMTPRRDGQLTAVGTVGDDIGVPEARAAARLAVGNAVDAAESCLSAEEFIRRCLRMTVYIAAVPSFKDHSTVADAASAVVRERLGDSAVGPRTAIGVTSLPSGAPVEIEVVVEVGRRPVAAPG